MAAARTQADYRGMWADIRAGARNGHPLVQPDGVDYYRSTQPQTGDQTLIVVIHYSDDTPPERLEFHSADGVDLHPGGA